MLTSVPILDPQDGYDRAAGAYDVWHWLEFWRRNEVPVVASWIEALTPGVLLDAGSGTGLYRGLIESAGHTLLAVDVSRQMLLRQQERHPAHVRHRSYLVQADVCQLPIRSASVNHLLSTRVLSHISSVETVAAEFARVASTHTDLLIADVHPAHPYSSMSINVRAGRVSIKIYKHSIGELTRGFEHAGFEVKELREYRLRDISWRPPFELFRKIYDAPDTPIFYVGRFIRI